MKYLKTFESAIYDEEDPKIGDYVFLANSDYTPDYLEIYKIRDIIDDDEKIYILDNIDNNKDNYISVYLVQIVYFSENLEDLEEIRVANKYNI